MCKAASIPLRRWLLCNDWRRFQDVLETAIGDVLKARQRPAVFAPELGELKDWPAPEGLEDLREEVLKRAEGPVPVIQAPVPEEGPALLFRYPTFRILVVWAVPGPRTAIRVGTAWAMKALGGDFDGDTLGVIPIRPEDSAFISRQKADVNEAHEAAKTSIGRTDEVQFVFQSPYGDGFFVTRSSRASSAGSRLKKVSIPLRRWLLCNRRCSLLASPYSLKNLL